MSFRKSVAVVLIISILVSLGCMPGNYIQVNAEPLTVSATTITQTYLDFTVEDIVGIINEFEETTESPSVYTVYDIPIDSDIQVEMEKIAEFYGIDHLLLFAIAMKETGCDPDAVGDSGRSLGMYQIQPRWWTNYIATANLHDVLESTDAACFILDYLYSAYGDTMKVLNAYNTGDPNKYNGYSAAVLSIYDELKLTGRNY